ncbi:SRPBCC domain-containing protein [Tenacibaculum tangerinum]|uniref:SRPBCC domain-containing protein n=1 Tax=Tenacibaculum tangerinum TaxID=3038772 RepID=A0ABY8L1Y1_9FLAO|nr:SRPBCC domain-containing protein [Tenacibaculum tangerinum]WGH75461.1 SRPBCC domain-containing protein [Tenacibaculum tangerinum]
MTKKISAQININATPEKVWSVLTNIHSYPEWNPFITKIEGILAIGKTIKITVRPEGSSTMTFKPTILTYTENKILLWQGKLLVKGLFDGKHKFELIDNENGSTTFIQSEIFTGILVGIFDLTNTEKGFEKMNVALKKRCENS